MLTSIVGINWGDEGKGRMVDLISQEYDIVARYPKRRTLWCAIRAETTPGTPW